MKLLLLLLTVILMVAFSYGLPTRSGYTTSSEEFGLESYANSRALRRARQSYGNYYYPSYDYVNPFNDGIRRRDLAGQPGPGQQFEFQPIVRYKDTKAKRKKLFVPNLFG
ncbi:hypothetical protein ACFFRR_008451 [Megaselia abdita]